MSDEVVCISKFTAVRVAEYFKANGIVVAERLDDTVSSNVASWSERLNAFEIDCSTAM